MVIMVGLDEHCRLQGLLRVGIISYSDQPWIADDYCWYQTHKATLILLELKKQSPGKDLF